MDTWPVNNINNFNAKINKHLDLEKGILVIFVLALKLSHYYAKSSQG